MNNDSKIQSRKKFIGISLTAAAMFAAFRFLIPEKKEPSKTVKMLTQDGRLVEVDTKKILESERLLCLKGKKISDEQLKNWVYKK